MTSYIRKGVWAAKGMMEYTKGGYEKAAKSFNSADLDVDLSQRSIMITGANSGIGKVTALEVAKRGATVHMVCRSKERGEQAKTEISEKANSAPEKVHLHIVDISQPRQVLQFAKDFVASEQPLDTLVNNAGCMVNERTYVEGDLETNFAANTLGTYILCQKMLPALTKSAKPRCFIVSSGGMLTEVLKLKDINNVKMSSFDGTAVYAQNKRQQIVMSEYLAKQHPNVFWATMHPGWADTPAVQNSMPEFREKMINRLRTEEQGADTLVWMCAFKDLEQSTKEKAPFYQDRKVVPKHLPGWPGTSHSAADETELIKILDDYVARFST